MGTRILMTLGVAAAVGGCAKSGTAESAPPAQSNDGTQDSAGDASCPPGGPSVSINVNRPSGDPSLPRDELGALLGWIGSFAQPCRALPEEAHHFSLVFELGESGEAPTFEFVEREQHPELAACLDEEFARASAPPPGPMRVSLVIPWRCNTLGPGFAASSDESQDEAASPSTP